MDAFEGMPKELRDLLKKMGAVGGVLKIGGEIFKDKEECVEGKCECQQVAKLQGAELLLLKTNIAKSDEGRRKAMLMESRINKLRSETKDMWTRFWEVIYKKYGLMSKGDYHWSEDGTIHLINKEKRGHHVCGDE